MSKHLLENFAWYEMPHIGWRIIHISGKFDPMWHATMLGAGMIFKVHPSLIHPIDPRTVKSIHSETRNGVKFDCYSVSPAPGLGGPFHWYADMDDRYAGGDTASEADAKAKALAFIEEKQPKLMV